MHRASDLIRSASRRLAAFFDPQLLRIFVPVVPLLCLVPWVWHEVQAELGAPLFRDAAMIQYTGWCIRHGMRLYKDAATPDGPFIHFFHALLQVFCGTSDAGARRGDLVVQLVGSGVIGAALAPRLASGGRAREAIVAVWTVLGIFAWLPWYLTGGWEHTVQRDPYYALFGYLGMVLLYVSGRFGRRGALVTAFAGGVLVTLQLFTRQSGLCYPALALLGLLVEGTASPLWKERLRWGFLGAAAAVLSMLLALLVFGSVPGFFFWYFRVPVDVYRFIGTKRFSDLYTHAYAPQLALSLQIAVGVVVAIAGGLLPARAIGFALAPFLFVIAACAVGKGWINHVQQTMAAENIVILIALSAAWQRGLDRRVWGQGRAAVAMVLLGLLVTRVVDNLSASPFNNPISYDPAHVGAEQVAEDLKRTTSADDRVFYYAHEMHGLLLSGRKTALPMISDMVLNFDAWIKHEPPYEAPTTAEMATFEKMQSQIAADACQRLLANPPAAVVAAPNDLRTWSVTSFDDDLRTVCPAFVPVLASSYRMHTTAGYQLYLRNDHSSPPQPSR